MNGFEPRHVLVVTGDFGDGAYMADDRQFHIEHHGPIVDCALWVFCPPELECHRQAWNTEGSMVAHGVEHAWVEDTWAVRSDPPECIYTTDFAANRLGEFGGELVFDDPNGSLNKIPLVEGRYVVDVSWLGDGDFDLDVVKREAVDA